MRTIVSRAMLGIVTLFPVASVQAEPPAPGRQVEQQLKAAHGQTVDYLLYLPTNYVATREWPLLLFLHGRGESEGPLARVKKWGPPRLIERGEPFPYIVASPQCPKAPKAWDQPAQQALLLQLLEHLCQSCTVDRDRVYLTGLSMGGYGSWRLAADHLELFAAVVPVCGAGQPADAARLVRLPIWAWHGTEDKAVPFQRSVEMVEAIRKAGGTRVRFTSLEHIGHNSWEAAYGSPELYQWLEAQRASRNRAE